MTTFTIEINYGGVLVRKSRLEYVGGRQEVIKKLDGDTMSMFEIESILSDIGVTRWKKLQYCHPRMELDTGLRILSCDADIISMVNSLDDEMYAKMYVEEEVQDFEGAIVHYSGEDTISGDCSFNVDANIEIEVAFVSASFDDLLHSLNRSDSESREELTEFTSACTDVELGMTFGSLTEIKNLVVDFAVQNGHNIKFIKNEKNVRLTAICADGCKWRLHASKMHNEMTFQIKSYNNNHTCARIMENRHVIASWVAKTYKERFKSQIDWQIPSIIDTVRQDYNVNINRSLAYRAKIKAKKWNYGCSTEQYKQLWSYAEEIFLTNPRSTFIINLDVVAENSSSIFQRAYMCFDACKQGMLTGARPLVCLDGCHLKGQCRGILLTAVGIDGNDGIYPIAIAVVESECISSCKWFMDILAMDLRIGDGLGWTFMSDRQKGLIDMFDDCVPLAEKRYCVRHMYANFKSKFRGKIYKDAMMNASRATTAYDFEKEMLKLSDLDNVACLHLRKSEPKFWAKHAFSHVSKCDMTLNNLSESFNSFILPARDKPIITMFEIIRKLLMARIAKRHKIMMECTGLLCPKIMERVNKLINSARNWSPIPAEGDRFEVSDPNVTYIVDLANRRCSCSAWELTGIPCVHVIPCLLFLRRNVEEFVDPYYHRQTYLTMYSHFMHPIHGPEKWPITDKVKIMSPIFRRRPGRPKKKRIRDPDEPRSSNTVSRKHKQLVSKCRKCHETGHNSRTCQGSTSRATATHSQADNTSGRRGRGRGRQRHDDTFMGFNRDHLFPGD